MKVKKIISLLISLSLIIPSCSEHKNVVERKSEGSLESSVNNTKIPITHQLPSQQKNENYFLLFNKSQSQLVNPEKSKINIFNGIATTGVCIVILIITLTGYKLYKYHTTINNLRILRIVPKIEEPEIFNDKNILSGKEFNF
jgi:ABC-type glycerol-3-phosphate transport system permease component